MPEGVVDAYATARACGGSHTVTSSHKRLARMHHHGSESICLSIFLQFSCPAEHVLKCL